MKKGSRPDDVEMHYRSDFVTEWVCFVAAGPLGLSLLNTWRQRINLSIASGSDGALAERAAFGSGGSDPSLSIVLFCL